MRTGLLLLGLALLASCGNPPTERSQRERSIARAAEWLWSQQAADGGWHSETYGLLASGQSLTPLVLHALLEAPTTLIRRPAGAVERALAFLRSRITPAGALGLADEDLADYPCYATALALRAIGPTPQDAALRERMALWLLDQQLGDANGWTPSDPSYGAWGMGGEVRRPPLAGHVDLSMTRHVLEALAPLNPRRAVVRASRRAARHFLERVRVRGSDPATTLGFFFTPVITDKNKAGPRAEGGFEPYGTTNADGVLALLALGVPTNDPKVQSVARILAAAHRVDRTPGPVVLVESGWAAATVFYYRAASAEVFARCAVSSAPAGHDWRTELVQALAAAQASDGHFANPATSMKEDDPLIATSLALRALVAARP